MATNSSTGDAPELELAKTYDPAQAEQAAKKIWNDTQLGGVVPQLAPGQQPYAVVIPPPNVTAALHLGHALNSTLQDVLVRYHRMIGDLTWWVPGTDHAGIATQTVVEKRLLSEGVKRTDIGREAFVAKTQEWKDEYEAVIISQLQALGASCDWDRTRFTMDEMCATAVRHGFFKLFDDGLIYRGKRLVNWDPATQTALADDEVEAEEVPGHMWYLKYPLADGSGHVVVATTRPETMFGDTAVAINPKDPRAESLRGKQVRLPIVDRLIPIVEDDYVVLADPQSSDPKAQYATGMLKVTPAHDQNDWEIGLRHDLAVINVMGPDAAISDQHGWLDVSEAAKAFVGLSREAAREAVVSWFEANDLLDNTREYSHSVGHSYRSHVPIEPWLSDQWYVAVTDDRLRGAALRAQSETQNGSLPSDIKPRSSQLGDGEMSFFPQRYAKTYAQWHENIRDWCISRQLWWGHQIPVWNKTSSFETAESYIVDSLETSDVGGQARLESDWSKAGAVHVVRKINDTEVEESVCLPPDSTLRRLERSDATMDETALVAALETDGFVRDPDVLDTWFSSGLWPMSTMGWPWPEDFEGAAGLLSTFNPTAMLATSRDIITLWVSRMTMFNRYFLDGQIPFKEVFVHALIQDTHGQKMSKSLGNGVDPRDIIDSHGADAMRFTLVQMSTDTQDVRMPVELICPHSGEVFEPEFVKTKAGHLVAAPTQTSPTDPTKTMVTAYGFASGQAKPTDEAPLARNTSSKFDLGRNFSNKVWNATRFALGRISEAPDVEPNVDITTTSLVDQWIVERLGETLETIDKALAEYRFNYYADALYSFVWNDFCDRYLEAIKPTIDDDVNQQVVLGSVLDSILRMLHPVCPFITEILWPHVSDNRFGEIEGIKLGATSSLATSSWPAFAVESSGSVAETFERADKLSSLIRNLRAQRGVKPKHKVSLHVGTEIGGLIAAAGGAVETLAGVGEVEPMSADAKRPLDASPLTFEGYEFLVSGLTEEIDIEAERGRLKKITDSKAKEVASLEGRLANENYVSKAKPELVAESRKMLELAKKDLLAAETSLESLPAN